MARVAVIVEGGLVQDVLTSDESVNYNILDWDYREDAAYQWCPWCNEDIVLRIKPMNPFETFIDWFLKKIGKRAEYINEQAWCPVCETDWDEHYPDVEQLIEDWLNE